MIDSLRQAFEGFGVEYAEALPFATCRVINERKLATLVFSPQSVIVFAIPYYAGAYPERNLSRYALAKDYHLFFKSFSEDLISFLKNSYPFAQFTAFSDNSPIDERQAALMAGLGILGKHGLVITPKYSSYVFLGEILCDISYEEIGTRTDFSIKECEGCGRCLTACPKTTLCLSALTQKKGELTEKEALEIQALGMAWGCDICQDVCPHSQQAKMTPIAFFKEDLMPVLSPESLASMSEEDFSARAFAWRGRKTIERNLALFEKS